MSFTVEFHHCASHALFMLQAPWSSAVYATGLLVAKDLQP